MHALVPNAHIPIHHTSPRCRPTRTSEPPLTPSTLPAQRAELSLSAQTIPIRHSRPAISDLLNSTHTHTAPVAASGGPRGIRQVRAVYGYDAADADELSFAEGDVIILLEEPDASGWARCVCVGLACPFSLSLSSIFFCCLPCVLITLFFGRRGGGGWGGGGGDRATGAERVYPFMRVLHLIPDECLLSSSGKRIVAGQRCFRSGCPEASPPISHSLLSCLFWFAGESSTAARGCCRLTTWNERSRGRKRKTRPYRTVAKILKL